MKARLLTLAVLLASAAPLAAQKVDERQATVGMRARIEQLVLPGTVLRARALDDPELPIVLRVLETWPHGELFRYDLEYVGLEPGTFDLGAFLERIDGSSTDDLPPIPVEIEPVLPWDRVEPNAPERGALPQLGGYQALWIVGGVVWVLGLGAILLVGRRRRQRVDAAAAAAARPVTLADRLQPRVEAALAGALDDAGKAELERLLLSHWRARLGLSDRSAAAAITAIRRDPEAGALLRALEEWLHRPGGERDATVDVAELLRPYREVRAEDPQ